jgi:hypothetical protein
VGWLFYEDLFIYLPVTNASDLQNLDEYLTSEPQLKIFVWSKHQSTETIYWKLTDSLLFIKIEFLALIGGSSLEKVVKGALNSIFSRSFAVQLSYSGRGTEKIAFNIHTGLEKAIKGKWLLWFLQEVNLMIIITVSSLVPSKYGKERILFNLNTPQWGILIKFCSRICLPLIYWIV